MWSAIPALARSALRTGLVRRPPRHGWGFVLRQPALWHRTTRPPRGRSGSPVPVGAGCDVRGGGGAGGDLLGAVGGTSF
jgi:hypothetical protein